MEEESIISIIAPFLRKYNIQDFDILKSQEQKHLISIEKYLQNCNEILNVAKKDIKQIEISVRGICRGANIGKSTVYNSSEILKKYIENRLTELECNIDIVSKHKLSALENKNKELSSLNDKLIVDNIEFMNIKLQNQELNKIQNSLIREREALVSEKNQLKQKLNELSVQLKKEKSNVVQYISK